MIHVPPYVLHRDPRNFVFPDTFWPERRLIASGHLSLASAPLASPTSRFRVTADFQFVHNEAAFIPFSHGLMNCPGKGLAMQQIKTVVCALVQRFRFRLREGWDYLTANRPELPVELEPR